MLITCEVNLYQDKRVLNDVKMVLFMEQFGLEVTSSRFCAVYNLGMKLVQVVLRSVFLAC